MKSENAAILYNQKIAEGVYEMELSAAFAEEAKPGQFIEIDVPGYYLRRPISISRIHENSLVIVYKVLGEGTRAMSLMKEGESLNIFGPLGHGFAIASLDHVVLVGGGVGVPPLMETAKQYRKHNVEVDVVLGFNSKSDAFGRKEFERYGCKVYEATMDGSLGTKGTVIDAIHENKIDVNYIQACGPLPMLKAINSIYPEGEISLEARMACGIGACMGCVVKDTEGKSMRVCKDGPVFPIGKVAL